MMLSYITVKQYIERKTEMKIPYITDKMTRKMARKLGTPNTGGIAVTILGIIIYELAFTADTLKNI